jgi:carbamoyl-phosphate synthase large subunit
LFRIFLMKVLITSIGSISASYVINSVRAMGFDVIGVDTHPKAWVATSSEVDFFAQVPAVKDTSNYENAITNICLSHDVKLLIPLTDVDVDFLSTRISKFNSLGIVVSISKPNIIRLLRNKMAIYKLFENTVVPVIPTYSYDDYFKYCCTFPCLMKPVNGRSSEGQMIFYTPQDIPASYFPVEQYIFQPFFEGNVVTVDILKTQRNQSIFIARRELTRTKNGAGIAVEILEINRELLRIINFFSEEVEFEGCINVEFIEDLHGRFFLMDTNPRFSAGVSFSGLAGYNFASNHVRHFMGLPVDDIRDVSYGSIFTRKYIEVIS